MKARVKQHLPAFVLAWLLTAPGSAQYWAGAQVPVQYFTAPTVCYTDTVHDWLIAAGQTPLYVDSLEYYMPVMRYDGTAWDTLGLFGNKVNTAVVYHDTLLVAGGFTLMQNQAIGQIACYVDGEWQPYGNFADQWGDGMIIRLRVIGDELYALGLYENADGQLCNGLAKRVGGHWEAVPGWADMNFIGAPWLHDIIRFQGKLVVCGNYHLADQPWNDILQYDGNAWVPVCDDCLQGGLDGLHEMAVYHDELYVGGIFYYGSGNAGQGIMRWDGEQWYPLGQIGNGVQADDHSDQYSPDIGCLKVRDDVLFIGGGFNYVNHMATPAGICTWDGTDFCILEGSPFSDYYMPFDFYHDTLYGGTGPDATIEGLVRYLSTDYFHQCSTLGIVEQHHGSEGVEAVWTSEGNIILLGLANGPHAIRIYDATGILVTECRVSSFSNRSEPLPFRAGPTALYIVVVDDRLTTKLASVP